MKKILIAVLAVAVLFGFAACNDGSSATTSGVIAGARVSGGGETVYIPGETLNLGDYTFTLVMADGSEQPANASDFVFDSLVIPFADNANDKDVISGTYKGISTVDVDLAYNVAKVTKIELSGTAAKTSYYKPSTNAADKFKDDSLDLTGLTVTATYTDVDNIEGTKPVALDNDYLFATATWTNAGDTNVTVAFGEDKSSATSGNVKDTYEITIVDNLVKSIQLKTTEDYSVILGEKGATALAYANVSDGKLAADAKGIYVEATYENGETSVLENTNMKFGTKADDITKAIADVSPTTAGTSTIYVEVSKLDAVVGFEKTSSCDVTAKENVIDDIKVTVGTVEAKDYRESAAKFKALFTVNGLYADDTNTGDAVAAADITVDPSAPDYSSYDEGERVVVKVTAKIGDKTFSKDVTVKLAAAASGAGDGGDGGQ